MNKDKIETRLREAFTDALVEVTDLVGDGNHWEAAIVTPDFSGLRPIQRHQKVYEAFSEELRSGELHALSLKTLTPEEAAEKMPGGRDGTP